MTPKFANAIAAAEQTEAIRQTPAMVPGRQVHIDGDYLCYYAAGNDDTDPGQARLNASNYIENARVWAGAEKAILHLTASGCHKGERYLVATRKPYQGQRSSDRRPVNWRYLREWSCGYTGDQFVKKVWATREADDGIAACAQYAAGRGDKAVICTADKDMQMLPGIHLDWKDNSLFTEVPPDGWEVIGHNGKTYGEKWFWLQMLHGDSADNIPGLEFVFAPVVPGKPERMNKVGPAGALKIIQGLTDPQDVRNVVQDTYLRSYRGTGDGADRFAEQAALLWLRRDNAASVRNFADFMGDRLAPAFHEAFDRLVERVADARKEIEALSS